MYVALGRRGLGLRLGAKPSESVAFPSEDVRSGVIAPGEVLDVTRHAEGRQRTDVMQWGCPRLAISAVHPAAGLAFARPASVTATFVELSSGTGAVRFAAASGATVSLAAIHRPAIGPFAEWVQLVTRRGESHLGGITDAYPFVLDPDDVDRWLDPDSDKQSLPLQPTNSMLQVLSAWRRP